MAITRELVPTIVRAFSRVGDDLGLGRLPWPNVGSADVVEVDDAYVVNVVAAPYGSAVDTLVKVAPPPA
jgi:hypothetical protein